MGSRADTSLKIDGFGITYQTHVWCALVKKYGAISRNKMKRLQLQYFICKIDYLIDGFYSYSCVSKLFIMGGIFTADT